MNAAIALTAALYGATVVNHAEVDQLLKDHDSGKIVGVRVRDLLPTEPSGGGGDSFVVRTKVGRPSLPLGSENLLTESPLPLWFEKNEADTFINVSKTRL